MTNVFEKIIAIEKTAIAMCRNHDWMEEHEGSSCNRSFA